MFTRPEATTEKVHQAALRILDELGVKVEHEGALTACAEAGGRVDRERRMVRFAPDIVERLLENAPARFAFGGRDRLRDGVFGAGQLATRPVAGPVNVIDWHGACRPATSQDARAMARLVDGLDAYVWNSASIYPHDIASACRDIEYARLLFEHTTKHFMVSSYSAQSLAYMIDMGQAVAGGAEAFRRRPLFHTVISPQSPLKYSAEEVRWIEAAGKAGVPLGIASAPIMGGTGPVTQAGACVLIHTETMAGICLSQALHAGMAVFAAPRANVMEMKSGISLWGPIEMGMIDTVCAHLAHRCGVPCDLFAFRTDAKVPDEQAAYERMGNGMLALLSAADCLSGAGMLETALSASFEQMVIDADILLQLQRVRLGIDDSEEKMAVELLLQLGPEAHFLGEAHTRRHHRGEVSGATLASRESRAGWESAGRKTLVERAHEQVHALVRQHQVAPLEPGLSRELDTIVERARVQIQHD